jgi:muramoyltetrapeptide carboxypeptidase LdcA involved in peptidoglycan recycling
VSVGEHAYGQYGRFAGTEVERLADLNAAFADA